MTSEIENVVIIGSGPAAWTVALYLARAGLNPVLFEGKLEGNTEIPGGQLMNTTEIENFPGFPDGGIEGWDLMDRLKKQGTQFGTRVISDKVVSVNHKYRDNGHNSFIVTGSEEESPSIQTKAVIIATGATAKYLGLESEQKYMNRGVSACATCDGSLLRFRNKPIVVVGGGDTAMEEAMFLSRFASTVYLVHRRDSFRASPIMVKRVTENPKIKTVWNSIVTEVLGNETDGVAGIALLDLLTKNSMTLECSGMFVAIGHKPNSELFVDFVTVDETGYIQTEGKSSRTDTPGIFACGDVQDNYYRQAITAAGSGCVAAIDCIRWLEEQDQE